MRSSKDEGGYSPKEVALYGFYSHFKKIYFHNLLSKKE